MGVGGGGRGGGGGGYTHSYTVEFSVVSQRRIVFCLFQESTQYHMVIK